MKRLIYLLVLLSACAMQQTHDIVNLEPKQTKDLLDTKENMGLFVLNVHTPYEGKLDKTDMIIEEWENIAKHQDHLPQDKHTPILVYCRSGRMSTSAAKQLQDLGYTNIYHLNGGMKAWDAQGLPLMDKAW
ncbi:rhodanese-like domain-containing protein [Candidatus Woesearchaeota archaeon]|nr:rhodanese-like domain-containing protein [Candidatus Woesearchaeota archaeon]